MKKKRYLKGSERIKVQQTLLHKKAILWRREEAQKSMKYGDPEPSQLYSVEVLRKARQEGKDKELGLHNIKNIIESIIKLMNDVQYAGVIKKTGLKKFFLMYWSPLQVDIYKELSKFIDTISIDATGSIVQKIDRGHKKSGAIFLYQAVAPGIKGILPLCQMLLEKHDANIIEYWLKEWKKAVPVPREVVTDCSFALVCSVNGVTSAFNKGNLSTYIEICFQCLESEKNIKTIIPECLLRLDIAHIIKIIARWKCFYRKRTAPRIKDFYMRCVAFMTTVETKSQFEDMLFSIIIVALSECDDKTTECANKQEFLLNIIRTFTIDETWNESDVNDTESDVDDTDSNVNDTSSLDEMENELKEANLEEKTDLLHFKELHSRAESFAKEARTGKHPNAYYCPQFVKPFLRFAKYYVLWTTIMPRIKYQNKSKYSVASSARSEAYFNDVKHITLSDEGKPIRLDKFFIKHVNSIQSICKIERAALNNRAAALHTLKEDKSEKKASVNKSFIDVESLTYTEETNAEENWRGLNPSTKRRKEQVTDIAPKKRGKYLRACPDISLIHNRPLRKKRNGCIQNASILPPVKIGTTTIQVLNSCPFDALTELLATTYADFVFYNQIVNEDYKDLLFFQLIRNYAINGDDQTFYCERASCLSMFFNIDKSILNCVDNISALTKKLLDGAPSIKEESICSVCSHKEIKNISIAEINSKPILQHGLYTGLQISINSFFSDKIMTCTTCDGKIFSTKSPNAHLLIDVEHVYHSTLLAHLGFPDSPKNISLAEVPVKLKIKNETYQLIGLINYINSENQEHYTANVGHYTAYCYRITGIWEEYDSLEKNACHCRQKTYQKYL